MDRCHVRCLLRDSLITGVFCAHPRACGCAPMGEDGAAPLSWPDGRHAVDAVRVLVRHAALQPIHHTLRTPLPSGVRSFRQHGKDTEVGGGGAGAR